MKAGMTTVGMLIALATAFGCEAPEMPDSGATAAAPAANADADRADASSAAADADRKLALKNRANPEIPDPGDVAPVTDEPREVTRNDPMQGRRSRAAGGYLGAVMGAGAGARNQIVYDVQVKSALNLYWGEHGEYPQSHEEFMEKIIKFNQLQLPELMPDQEYIYVPEKGQNGLSIQKKQPTDSTE